MSLGLPGHLAPHSEGRAFARASHVVAAVCLVATLLLLVALQQDRPSVVLWPAMLALLPMLVALWLIEHYRTRFFSVVYLLVGSASIYWYVLAGTEQFPGTAVTDSVVLSLPKVALIMIGGSGVGGFRAAGWSVVGAVLAELVTIVAALHTGAHIVLDGTVVIVLGVVLAGLAAIGLSRQRVRLAQPSLHRAARDEHLSDLRRQVEVRAAAVMHDTILGHLAAISIADNGPLRPELESRIRRDLEVIVGEEWLMDATRPALDDGASGWLASKAFRAVDEARELGLDVVLTGDRAAISRLDGPTGNALALALKQCLVNVLGHSGTNRAEVVIYGSGSEVSVMVIDEGKGFTEGDADGDRLGLRQSVRRRIEAVDGSVQVWSTPGTGTSVLIRVPATEATP